MLDVGFTIDDEALFVCLGNGMERRMYLNQAPQDRENVVGPLEYSSGTGISRIPHCASFSSGCNLLADADVVSVMPVVLNRLSANNEA